MLPRVGATYDVTDWLSVYGSYSEGLRGVSYFAAERRGAQARRHARNSKAA